MPRSNGSDATWSVCACRGHSTLDHLVQQIERGQLGTIEAIEMLLGEELTIRETRRI